MARSRSSFELTSAIATASTLAKAEQKKPNARAPGLPASGNAALVSFQPADAPTVVPPPLSSREAAELEDVAPGSTRVPPPPSRPHISSSGPPAIPPPPFSAPTDVHEEMEVKPPPPKLPDLTNVVSPIVRCERIVEWIREATGGTGVFIADADGLPIAGDIADAEAQIGASGLVASSIATLLHALPGQPAPLFDVHIGDGPYFQLIGFVAAKGSYVVGLTRDSALSPRQAHAIRLACRLAFGESLSMIGNGSRL